MADIIQFPGNQLESTSEGECVCSNPNCKHEWIGDAPAGATQVECPKCYTMQGHFKWPFGAQPDELAYECNCGCEDFFIMKKSMSHSPAVYCRGCGCEATGWIE